MSHSIVVYSVLIVKVLCVDQVWCSGIMCKGGSVCCRMLQSGVSLLESRMMKLSLSQCTVLLSLRCSEQGYYIVHIEIIYLTQQMVDTSIKDNVLF